MMVLITRCALVKTDIIYIIYHKTRFCASEPILVRIMFIP